MDRNSRWMRFITFLDKIQPIYLLGCFRCSDRSYCRKTTGAISIEIKRRPESYIPCTTDKVGLPWD